MAHFTSCEAGGEPEAPSSPKGSDRVSEVELEEEGDDGGRSTDEWWGIRENLLR